jgi:hypothetical protein
MGSRAGTSRFQAVGELHSTLAPPHRGAHIVFTATEQHAAALGGLLLVVAVQVDPFESKGLKPGFSLDRLNG